MSKTISAIYEDRFLAQHAVNLLKDKGIKDHNLSILASSSAIDKKFELEKGSKAAEGTVIGAGTGAALGATLAGLTAVGTVTATGGFGLLAAGPVVAAFTGAGAGAGAGGVIGGLVGMGFPETKAKLVDEKLGQGHVMLGVSVDEGDDIKHLEEILKNTNSEDVTVY